MSLVSRLGVVLGLDTAQFNKNLGLAQQGLKTFAVGAGVVGTALSAAGMNALKFADQIDEVATANEIAAETVLELSTALTLSGGQADNVGKLFASLTNKLDEAGQGNKKAEESFAKLGVSLTDIKTLNPDELFRKTLNSLAGIENTVTRNAAAMELFGKGIKGVDVKGMNKALEETKGAFDGVGESFQKAAEGFDTIDRIFINMKAGFATELGGAFNAWAKGAERFVEMLSAAKQGLKDLISIGDVILNKVATGGRRGTIDDLRFGSVIPNQESVTGGSRTSPYKSKEELAKDADARKAEIARLDKIIANKEAKEAEAARQKIKDAEKLTNEVNKQKEALERKLLLTKSEIENMGKTLTETEKLNLEFEKGGSLEHLKGTLRAKALIDATKAKDLAIATLEYERQSMENELAKGKLKQDAREANKLEIKNLEIATERLNLTKAMAGQSDTQVQLALRYYDLQQAILDKKKEGLLTDEQIYDFAIASMNNIEAEEANARAQNTFQAGWDKAYNNFIERAQDSAALGAEAFNSMSNSMTSALDRFVQTGKLSFSSLVSDMIRNLLRLQMQAQISGLFGMLGDALGGIGWSSSSTDFANGGGIKGFLGFANGGEPPVGVPSIVGERGAELFVPKTAGTIIPNNQLSSLMGSQPQVVYNGPYIANMNTIDSKSFEQRIYQSSNAVWAAHAYASKSMPTTGGRT